MQILSLPQDAIKIINSLHKAGFEAYAVGGCVRDLLMNSPCGDIDITTSALPEQTKSLFSDYTVVETGIKHGTVTVVINSIPYEITTFRTEFGYTDSRHPDSVAFVRDLKQDLARRDFTINAIAYSQNSGVVDCFGGIKDLENKIIRTVGNPAERYKEDALRILRALRFASVLDFKIEQDTKNAIFSHADKLTLVSPERIYTELKKLLLGKNAQRVIEEYKQVLSTVINLDGTTARLSRLPQNHGMRFACVCGSSVSISLTRLRADNETKRKAQLYAESTPIPLEEIEMKLFISNYGIDDARDIAAYRRAIFNEDETHEIEKIIASKTPLFLSDLAINGKDLQAIGVSGKAIGENLKALLCSVIKSEIPNDREALLKKAKEI